ncbi:MAG: S8 family serine peptidase [Clostridia bacterium]|nr:S8 family serine peptidase [Clostridia bacterium]
MSNKLGKSLNKDNEGFYIEENVKNKVDKFNKKQKEKKNNNQKFDASTFREEAEIGEILTNEEIENCIDAGKTYEQIIELSERYQYLSDFRHSRADINASVNELFEKSINRAKCKNVNIDMLLPYATMECKKNYISKLSSMSIVKEIGVLQQDSNDIENQESLIAETSEMEETVTDKYIMQPIDTPYTGAGIRVGVVDVIGYYPNADHLYEADITKYVDIDANGLSHSTCVLSILCGKKKSLNGVDYQGVAPNVSVYFARAPYASNNKPSLYWMVVEKNVSVINISMEMVTEENESNVLYNHYECYIDCLVQQYRVSIVKSSGNDELVTPPGKAYNLITVGNMSNQTDDNGKYLINASYSSFEEEPYLTNKPDICAFGTNVHMLYGGRETNLGYGTSLAAPQVTGTIALMMEANPALIGQPHKVKAILLTSANDENVSETDGNADDDTDNSLRCTTPTYNTSYFEHVTPITRNKTGAGILNTKAAIESALHPVTYSFQFTSNGSKRTNEIFIPSNMNIKVGLVFEKADHDLITENNSHSTNVNFEMIDISTGNVVFSSVDSEADSPSIHDNVKVFDVTTKVTGTYIFKIICSNIDVSDNEGTEVPEIHQS